MAYVCWLGQHTAALMTRLLTDHSLCQFVALTSSFALKMCIDICLLHVDSRVMQVSQFCSWCMLRVIAEQLLSTALATIAC